jgi:GxxExxY protein
MTENAIAREIVDAAFHIHTALGPGFLESVYHAVLAYELAQRGLHTESQQPIPVIYGAILFDAGFRADLIVNDKVIVEIKSVEVVAPVHKKQLLTYLRLADKRLGLLINFNTALLKNGITRIVNGLPEESLAKAQRRQEEPCQWRSRDHSLDARVQPTVLTCPISPIKSNRKYQDERQADQPTPHHPRSPCARTATARSTAHATQKTIVNSSAKERSISPRAASRLVRNEAAPIATDKRSVDLNVTP